MRHVARWVVPLAVVGCLVAGCGGGDRSAQGPTTTSAADSASGSAGAGTAPVTTREQLKEEILADYRKANDAYHDAINAGDPDLPSLAATHTGTVLATIRANLAKRVADGQHGDDGPHSRDTNRAVVQQILDGKAIVAGLSDRRWSDR